MASNKSVAAFSGCKHGCAVIDFRTQSWHNLYLYTYTWSLRVHALELNISASEDFGDRRVWRLSSATFSEISDAVLRAGPLRKHGHTQAKRYVRCDTKVLSPARTSLARTVQTYKLHSAAVNSFLLL